MTESYTTLVGLLCDTSEDKEDVITDLYVFEINLIEIALEKYEHYKINETATVAEDALDFSTAISKLEVILLKNKKPNQKNKSCLCTFGPHCLRVFLHPLCFRKGVDLSDIFYAYFDLQHLFKSFFGSNTDQQSLKFVTDNLDSMKKSGEETCTEIVNLVKKMTKEGFEFKNPEIIMKSYQPSPWKGEVISDELVVKTRGLPWNSTEADVANFFKGLNIEKGGVALCMYSQGRRNGEALVCFESREHKSLALKRHKHHLGSRYIEVFRATGKEFMQCLASSNKEAHALLMQKYDFIDPVIIRMRGLPFSCRESEVVEFFQTRPNECDILDGEGGVLLIYQSEGRTTGDAFVLFASEDEATKAMSKHKHCIGMRYIELFRSTVTEIQQVLDKSFDPRSTPVLVNCTTPHPSKQFHNIDNVEHRVNESDAKDCVRLFGLPPSTSINDLVFFLSDHVKDIRQKGVHFVYNLQGAQTGEVFIEVVGERQADFLQENKNGKMILVSGNRQYVHVNKCSAYEMNNLLHGVNVQISPAMSTEICSGINGCSMPKFSPMFCNYVSPYHIIAIPSVEGFNILHYIDASSNVTYLNTAIKDKVKF